MCRYLVFVFWFLSCWSAVFFGDPAQAYERRSPVVAAVAKAAPAVVNIRTEQVLKRRNAPFFGFADPFFEEFFRELAPPQSYTSQSLGSGVIIDATGLVLTNAHVIEKASKIFVALTDSSRELQAELVGMDARTDLAVLKIQNPGPFPVLQPARSDELMVGETVIAIGNPLGLGQSITTGVVSSKRRRLPVEEGAFAFFIQTDALINPGNSGGPLININGELIGINTAIIKQAQGIGFAIPIDLAKRVLGDLIRLGQLRPPFSGIIPGEVGRAFRQGRSVGGVLVTRVEPDSPAERAGVQIADVILALDGDPVESSAEFLSLLRTYAPEQRIHLSLLRGTLSKEVKLALATLPEDFAFAYTARVFGLQLAETRRGLVVEKVVSGSRAEQVGIRSGDLVVEIDGVQVSGQADLSRMVEDRIGREPLRFLVVRNGRGYYLELP
ncbi:MAG: trypsin-like peptidase domain-containing protein [Desulfuromonadaceae bacterium]